MYQSLTQTLSYRNLELEKAKILVLAPTGVAAINIGDTTIHTSLNILINGFQKYIPPLSDKMKSMLRNRLSEVKVINIYEKSMVSIDLLLHIHIRLDFLHITRILHENHLQGLLSLKLEILNSCLK